MVEISLSGITSGNWLTYDSDFAQHVGEKLLLTIVEFEKFEAQASSLDIDFALTLSSNVDVKILAPWLVRLKMVELIVENFTDGRVFTQARVLRDMGFKGEIKVRGPMMPDQAKFFARVGVDTLIVADANRVDDFMSVLRRYNLFYQTSADGYVPVFKLRHMKAAQISDQRKAS